MQDRWDLVAKSRTDFADVLDSLSDEQLAATTLCKNWTPLDVAAHLVSFVELSLPQMMMSMAKGGFDVDKAWAANADKYKAMGAPAISKSLRANASKTAPIKSFSSGLTIVDALVHTQDVRRPLGLDGELDSEALRYGLDWVTTHKQRKMHVEPTDIEGLRLEATDLDWSWGDGALVSGTGEAILLGINRRDVGAELTGDGVSKLSS